MKLYVDGKEVDSGNAYSVNISTNHNVKIGGYKISGDHEFNGYIKDVRIYNRALTANEISNIYNATK